MNYQNNSENKDKSAQTPPSELVPNLFREGWGAGPFSSTYVPLPIENVDTDQIIPARFLKATDKNGFGDNLFADWR